MPMQRFCWSCSRKLRGRHFRTLHVDRAERILHVTCAGEIEDGGYHVLIKPDGSREYVYAGV